MSEIASYIEASLLKNGRGQNYKHQKYNTRPSTQANTKATNSSIVGYTGLAGFSSQASHSPLTPQQRGGISRGRAGGYRSYSGGHRGQRGREQNQRGSFQMLANDFFLQ